MEFWENKLNISDYNFISVVCHLDINHTLSVIYCKKKKNVFLAAQIRIFTYIHLFLFCFFCIS